MTCPDLLYLDTETCGLHGPIVLVQYALGEDADVTLYSVWKHSIDETLALYEWFCEQVVCGFNLSFDWFHICQQYTTLLLLKEMVGGDKLPEDCIDEYASCEADGRDGPCVKPKSALDLMLVARKGAYQSTMDRKPIRIKRIPIELADPLIKLLDKNIVLPEIYFARKKNHKGTHWHVSHTENPELVDLKLEFAPSTRLKDLAHEIFKYNPLMYGDVAIQSKFKPVEAGWAPFATALSCKERQWQAHVRVKGQLREGYAWPGVIKFHIDHWHYGTKARQYASDDVYLLRKLNDYFKRPEPGDKDSVLACMVGAVRWRGYAVNIEGIKKLRQEAWTKANSAPKDPAKVHAYIVPLLSDIEKKKLRTDTGKISTKRVLLEEISKWKQPCLECLNQVSVMGLLAGITTQTVCEKCNGTGNLAELHPAAVRAKECLEARQARTEAKIWDKIIQAGRFHVSLNVIGAFSSRMSGTDGLNAQGINRPKRIRKQFPLAFGDLIPTGGDFASFEVSIADAIVSDDKLRDALRTCEKCKGLWPLEVFASQIECPHCGCIDDEGKPQRQKFHGIFAIALTDGKMTYDEILKTKGSSDDWYDKGKRGGFSQFYGGNWNTLVIRLGLSEEVARRSEEYFLAEYKGVARWREGIKDDFCSMRQDGGLGTKVEWHDPKEYVESLTGHRRYFTLENSLAKTLFNMSTALPDSWKKVQKLILRSAHRGLQKVAGAVMSALLAAAFNIQGAVMRAAANHVIQSTGAELTKMLQCRLWGLQPVGVHKWHIQPMNIHDEIMSPCLPEVLPLIKQKVDEFVVEYSKLVPLLAIDWSYKMETWADK